MKLYTIGFAGKTARDFFALLADAKVKTLWDIRLKNNSQLAAFSKYPDLAFFLDELLDIRYAHMVDLAPSPELLKSWRNKELDWKAYQQEFTRLMDSRGAVELIKQDLPLALAPICLLCSEAEPQYCHRSLVARIIKNLQSKTEIIHL
ncbi:MAG: DUF488 domain-containing protein [Candidatus Cloacimonadaceae bacterium]|jgi:uncharacterized protein (DUF488 family)|nr:DUF488 domain-containing protein [Candidatus Cloacimonadota bacterium]MDY0128447.1 DUF488 domain-containing protein [Candidatus Cloacimonadaceae bacterium]MCB5254844.1 DUF488 domain-containing protein [Candidatus Cloacimonadota bacterium]MCK9179049.1 DUF488 domain-containing protein [Candidatus Cloacimonadota bacterium]MCK9241975.1 DUF488 domain-containing protein [Candidatus Cloacimonadota bacterium]